MEIERKYLVDIKKIDLHKIQGEYIVQGYLSSNPSVRIRVKGINSQYKSYITIKGKREGISRLEYEYEIPFKDAYDIIDKLCDKTIKKYRKIVEYNGQNFEVDVFTEDNYGLIMAELELESEDQKIDLPDWILKEVTYDNRYYNSNLIKNPFKNWKN